MKMKIKTKEEKSYSFPLFKEVTDVCLCVVVSRWKAEDLGLWSCSWSICSARLHHLYDIFSVVTYQPSSPAVTDPNPSASSQRDLKYCRLGFLFDLPMEFHETLRPSHPLALRPSDPLALWASDPQVLRPSPPLALRCSHPDTL